MNTLIPARGAASMAMSHIAMALRFASEDSSLFRDVEANLRYALRELERARKSCEYETNHLREPDGSGCVRLNDTRLRENVAVVRMDAAVWTKACEEVGKNGLRYAIENIGVGVFFYGPEIQRLADRAAVYAAKPPTEKEFYSFTNHVLEVMEGLVLIMKGMTAVGLIADMAEALTTGKLIVRGIWIPLNGNPASDIATRAIVSGK